MYGFTLTLEEHFNKDTNIAELMGKLTHICQDIQLSTAYDNFSKIYTITLKDMCDIKDEVKKAYGGDDWNDISEKTSLCSIERCFRETLDQSYSGQITKAVFLFDKHGEGVHPVHEMCRLHVPVSVHKQLKTLEIITLTPGKQYWKKVAVWQHKHWYSQKIKSDSDGDPYGGYQPCLGASPWLGPFASKELAVEAAKDHNL